MKTNKFKGYCSLYNVNYYDTFIIKPHVFDADDGKRVPILKDYNLNDPNSAIGYALLSTKNDIGVMAICFLDEYINIDNIVLDGHITDVVYAEDLNAPRLVLSGNIRVVVLNQKEACPNHECVTAVRVQDDDIKRTPAQVIRSIITSYNYNRSDGYLLKLIKNVITRLEDKGPTEYFDDKDIRDDTDIFNGILVNLYGDYGTSPRYGWLDSANRYAVIKALKDEFANELQDTKTLIEMTPERYSDEELKELKSLIKELEESNNEN